MTTAPRTRSTLAWLLLGLAPLAGCAGARGAAAEGTAAAAAVEAGRIVWDTVHSPALVGNRLGDSPDRAVAVYLPPGYDSRAPRRYPTVYLLHGFGGTPTQWTRPELDLRGAMDSLITAGAARPMIVVMPDGSNAFGGSFYANSPVTGGWGDFVARDLVRHVDGCYRTVASAEGRGVAGWSMGGHGALHLAARHPDVFGAVYAFSACCLGRILDDYGPAHPAWRTTLALQGRPRYPGVEFHAALQSALAVLWSPDPAREPVPADLPFALDGAGGVVPAQPAHGRWAAVSAAGFVEQHEAGLRRLRGIGFDAGRSDGFRHIPPSARELSAALGERGIGHAYEEYEGTHGSHVRERMRTRMLPFLSRHLAAASR